MTPATGASSGILPEHRHRNPEQPCNHRAREKAEIKDSANKTPQAPELRRGFASISLNRALYLAKSLSSCPIEG